MASVRCEAMAAAAAAAFSPGLLAVKTVVAVEKPSILQITFASVVSKLSSHTVPQTPSFLTSTRPLDGPGTRRTLTVGTLTVMAPINHFLWAWPHHHLSLLLKWSHFLGHVIFC